MPTATTKLKPTDLCPKKPDAKFLSVDGTVATVEIQVTTKTKPIPSVVMQRLDTKAVQPVIERYRKIIQEETLILEKKIKALVAKSDFAAAEKMVAETQLSVRNATKGLQGAVNVAIINQLKQDAKNDKELLEAQVVAVLKGLFITLKIGISVAKLALSHGADVTAYVSLAKGAVEMVKLVSAALASEVKVRQTYMETLGKYRVAVAKNPGDKQKLDAKLDEIRRDHKNKVTALRQNLEKLSLRSDELTKKAQAAQGLPQGDKLKVKSLKMKQDVDGKLTAFLQVEKVAEDITANAKKAGVEFDERLLMQRLTLKDVVTFANDLKGVVKELVDLAT